MRALRDEYNAERRTGWVDGRLGRGARLIRYEADRGDDEKTM